MITFRMLTIITCAVAIQSGCKHPTEPPKVTKPLVADAGIDQTVNVGNYVVLDGTKSSGNVGDSLTYQWTSLSTDRRIFVAGSDRPISWCGFTRSGVFRFSLVVGNNTSKSPADTVVVTVEGRKQSVFLDPSLELLIRKSLGVPSADLTTQMLESLAAVPPMVYWVDSLQNLSGIEYCRNLSELHLSLKCIKDISPLANLVKLKKLTLDQNNAIQDISPLSHLTQLEQLDLFVNNISDVSPLAGLTNLKYLDISANPVTNISVLENLTSMEQILAFQAHVGSLAFVANWKNLNLLWFDMCEVTDISALSGLTNLTYVELWRNQIVDISALANLKKLSYLNLSQNSVSDISPLLSLVNLSQIRLDGNKISDLSPLVNNSGMGSGDILDITANPLSQQSINEYLPALLARGVTIIRLFKK